jgi:hypothetical protein
MRKALGVTTEEKLETNAGKTAADLTKLRAPPALPTEAVYRVDGERI